MRTKRLLALLAASVIALTVLTTPSATAAAQSCYGGALFWDAGLGDQGGDAYRIPGPDDQYDVTPGDGTRWYRASNRCNDVNLKINSYNGTPYVLAQVCYTNGQCESQHRFNAGDYNWREIKYGIADGTWFYVKFDWNTPRFYGVIAH
jgi:hypothetical protein